MTRSAIARWAPYACLACSVSLSTGAHAQDRLPTATGSSERAAFQAQGFPAGGFRLYPTLRTSISYDDNVALSPGNRGGDGFFTVAPSITARSQWNVHSLTASAFLRDNRYFKRTDQDNDQYGVGANGRLDVMRTLTLNGSAGYSHLVELRGTPGDLGNTDRFVEYDLANVSASVTKQINRVALIGGVQGSNYRFDDVTTNGARVDQQFRNRNIRGVNGRVEYQYSATTNLFVSGAYNRIKYTDIAAGDVNRSSRGYTVLGGVHFEITRLLRGEVGLGYLSQSFRDPRYSDLSGLNYSASLTYEPTQLTTVTFSARRDLTDSAIRQVSGVLASRFELSVEHELLRNLIVAGNIGYNHYRYRGIARTENRYEGGVGARYRLNRFLSAALSYDHVNQKANRTFGRTKYDSNRVTLSLIFAR